VIVPIESESVLPPLGSLECRPNPENAKGAASTAPIWNNSTPCALVSLKREVSIEAPGAVFLATVAGPSLTAGNVDGIVTAPIDKSALHAGGYDYPGHTEMLGHLTGARVAMMLASDKLRVVLATTHIPLREVSERLTAESITEAARLTRDGLRSWFGIVEPRIALCALNPHAGDGGRFGSEDSKLLAPAARAAGIDGPFPADTVFLRAMRGEFDAVIAPYHDVGMTAIKVASFGSAVNVTLGLPFPRTSPDHGTALDIAGLNRADPSSMIAATLLCASIVSRGQTRGGRRPNADRLTETRSSGRSSRAQ